MAIAAAALLFILASPEGVVSAYSVIRPSGILGRGLPQQRRPDPTATTHPHGAIARRPHNARRFLGSSMSNSGNDGGFVPPVHEKEDEEAAFIKSTLLSNFVFQGLSGDILNKLVLAFDRVELPPSSTIIEQGDKNIDYFYVIRDGEVAVTIDGEVLPGKYGTMSEGTMFGELAMLYSMPRKATNFDQDRLHVVPRGPADLPLLSAARSGVGIPIVEEDEELARGSDCSNWPTSVKA